MSTPRAELDKARTDLATIEGEINALLAAKSDASRSAASFAGWRADHDAKTAERERLATLIQNLESEVAAVEADEARNELLKRHAAKITTNIKLAARIKSDLAKANAILTTLVRDIANAAIDDADINTRLPEGVDPLIPADILARGRAPLPRIDLEKSRVWLWTTLAGHIVGDQDAVVDRGNGRGRMGEGPYSVNCTSALFEQVSYHPAEPAERPQPLWQLRLPQPDGPGAAFDGSRCNYASDALAELARRVQATEPRLRPVEIELRPVPSIAAGEEVAA
jgi:hypothetical protein